MKLVDDRSKKLLVLASGRGSNFKAILESVKSKKLRAQIAALAVSKKDCGAAKIARENGIPVIETPSETELLHFVRTRSVDAVVLAGYMKILSKEFIDSMRDREGKSRILNIHPSLLPKYPGKDAYSQAFQAQEEETGITVHLVEPEIDSGPILAQRKVEISGLKSITDVELRGLETEHALYPEVIDRYLHGAEQTAEIRLFPKNASLDSFAKRLTSDFARENPEIDPSHFSIRTAKSYSATFQAFESETESLVRQALENAVLNPVLDSKSRTQDFSEKNSKHEILLERSLLPGMTDNAGKTAEEALTILMPGLTQTRVQRKDLFHVSAADPVVLEKLRSFLFHPLLHSVRVLNPKDLTDEPTTFTRFHAEKPTSPSKRRPTSISITHLSPNALEKLSREMLWALSGAEMRAIQDHYKSLNREPTLGEMEVLAQTWSEHCKHKIFRGSIRYQEMGSANTSEGIPGTVKNLFRSTIAAATKAVKKPWLLSVFSDNAGIVAFTPDEAVCVKVETHNSPSAIDPFSGAITGIGGVHRDIIGTGFGAKPICNLDVFCVAPAKFDLDRPEGLLPPSRILEGIRAGVEAGGNPAGIPTIAGALVYDPSYLGKPLVFCGSVGVLPRTLPDTSGMGARDCAEKRILPGDAIVMVGGKIGRDGIHGATFSSLKMDSATSTQSSVVQLGDPFTQKRALDFILKARDLGLYRTLTDNGAGGLSSSVGELATLSGGAELDLTHAPLKAPDLKSEEILISESQERMTIAVPRESLDAFLALSKKMGVESTAMGFFTDSGNFDVIDHGEKIASLSLEFLHEGCPELQLEAKWIAPTIATAQDYSKEKNAISNEEALLALLASDNIRSKERFIRQYDHEVQGCSLVKPETQIDEHRSPNQSAAVLLSPMSPVAAVLGVGILPEYSKYDAYTMAQISLDEAVRNVLSSGAEYGREESVMALLDNFCWPDPVGNPKFAADLVRAGYGLKNAAIELGLPFISGKDSMKNDFRGKDKNGNPITISALPTVLVTALGKIPELSRARTSEFKKAGDAVYRIGPSRFELVGSQFEKLELAHTEKRALPKPDWELARKLYAWLGSPSSTKLKSCADISEGGLLTALSESLFAYGLGFQADETWTNDVTSLFGEGFHSFIVSMEPDDEAFFIREWFARGIPFTRLGVVVEKPELVCGDLQIETDRLERAWRE